MLFKDHEIQVDPLYRLMLLDSRWYIRDEEIGPLIIRRVGTHYQYFHRLITQAEERVKIVHRNGDTLDNRLANLAPSYPVKMTPNAEAYDDRWRSRITVKGAPLQAYFKTKQEAIEWWSAHHAERMRGQLP